MRIALFEPEIAGNVGAIGGLDAALERQRTPAARRPGIAPVDPPAILVRGTGHAQEGTPFKPSTLGRPAGDRTWTRPGTTGDTTGSVPGAKPEKRPGRVIVDEKPGRRPVDPGRPAAEDGAVDNGRPRTWERPARPARPAPDADGGAPKPKPDSGDKPGRSTVDNGRPPRTERPDRPAATDDNRRPPADTGKPTWSRPAPQPERPSRDQEKPKVERNREPERPIRVERPREPEKPKAERTREPEKPKEQEKPQPPPPARQP